MAKVMAATVYGYRNSIVDLRHQVTLPFREELVENVIISYCNLIRKSEFKSDFN